MPGASWRRRWRAPTSPMCWCSPTGCASTAARSPKGCARRCPRASWSPAALPVTDRFERTLVCADDIPREGQVAALGFYGARLRVGFGSLGGWDPFGPERLITRSRDNVLYELDGESALALYKRYLGPHAAGLPATGLLFPLALRMEDGDVRQGLVRTMHKIDEAEQSITFVGDVPEGSYARLMKANFERLIDGAIGAAR